MINIISIDVAIKSLALSVISYDTNYCFHVRNIINKCDDMLKTDLNIPILITILDELNTRIDNIYTIEYMNVVDIIPEKKIKDTDIVYRTQQLIKYLKQFDEWFINYLNNKGMLDDPVYVLIEYQMVTNDKSRGIASQLLYHFLSYNMPHIEVHMVGPSLKNTICICPELHYNFFVDKYMNNYDANKNHSKSNFITIMKHKNMDIPDTINKKNYDDIGDSILMSLAWYHKYIYKVMN